MKRTLDDFGGDELEVIGPASAEYKTIPTFKGELTLSLTPAGNFDLSNEPRCDCCGSEWDTDSQSAPNGVVNLSKEVDGRSFSYVAACPFCKFGELASYRLRGVTVATEEQARDSMPKLLPLGDVKDMDYWPPAHPGEDLVNSVLGATAKHLKGAVRNVVTFNSGVGVHGIMHALGHTPTGDNDPAWGKVGRALTNLRCESAIRNSKGGFACK